MEPRAYLGPKQNGNNRQGSREPAAAEGQQLQRSSAGLVAAFIGMYWLGAISIQQHPSYHQIHIYIYIYIYIYMPCTGAQREDPVFKLLAW